MSVSRMYRQGLQKHQVLSSHRIKLTGIKSETEPKSLRVEINIGSWFAPAWQYTIEPVSEVEIDVEKIYQRPKPNFGSAQDRSFQQLLKTAIPAWLADMRAKNSDNVLSGIKVGKGGDYETIDAAVIDASQELIAPWYRDDPELVVIVGDQALTEKYPTLAQDKQAFTNHATVSISHVKIGGLRVVQLPWFPSRSFMITRLDNLRIYSPQAYPSWYRSLNGWRWYNHEDHPSQIETYDIEDYQRVCLVENILLSNGYGGWS